MPQRPHTKWDKLVEEEEEEEAQLLVWIFFHCCNWYAQFLISCICYTQFLPRDNVIRYKHFWSQRHVEVSTRSLRCCGVYVTLTPRHIVLLVLDMNTFGVKDMLRCQPDH